MSTETRERSYRGISRRAALHYLENLGGERADDATVESYEWRAADAAVESHGWQATVDAETVGIGASLTLTEVTVRFRGRPETLDEIVEAFSQKAIRAGG